MKTKIPKDITYEKLLPILSEALGKKVKEVSFWVNENELRIKFVEENIFQRLAIRTVDTKEIIDTSEGASCPQEIPNDQD